MDKERLSPREKIGLIILIGLIGIFIVTHVKKISGFMPIFDKGVINLYFWIFIASIVGIGIVSYFLIYLLAKKGIFITFVPSGEIVFIISGNTLRKIIANVDGYDLVKVEGEYELIKSSTITKPKRKMIWWVGLPPYAKILKYQFSWDKIARDEAEEKEKGGKVEKFGDTLISHRSGMVKSLYFRYSYPFVVKDIEMVGQFKIDIFFDVVIEAVKPTIPVIFLKGKWLSLFATIIEGRISDYVKTKTEIEEGDKFSVAVDKFEAIEKEKMEGIILKLRSKFIEATGMKAVAAKYGDYIIKGLDDIQKVLTERQIANIEKEAIETRADAAASKITKEGKAKAQALENILTAAGKHSQGADVLMMQTFADGIKETEVGVLSLGQAGPQIQIPVSAQKRGEDK